MKNKKLFAIAALLAALLVPPVLANVYVPTGPPLRADAWTIQGLSVWDVSVPGRVPTPIGWTYSENPMYNPVTQVNTPKIEMDDTTCPIWERFGHPMGI